MREPPDKPMTLTIKLDRSLAAYLRAIVSGLGIHGNVQRTAAYLIREGVIRHLESEGLRNHMIPHLPKRLRDAWQHSQEKPDG